MEKIKLDSFINFKFLSGMKVSPNFQKVAFAIAHTELDKNEYHYDLYLKEDDKNKKLFSMKKNNNYIWENDESILFSYTKTKKEEKILKEHHTIYYRYDLLTKSIEMAYDFPFSCVIVKVLSNDKLLISSKMTEFEHQLYLKIDDQRKTIVDQMKKDELYENINEIPFYFNGEGFTTNKKNQLFIYHTDTKLITPIVEKDFSVGVVRVSDNNQKIYYTGEKIVNKRNLTSKIYAYHINEERTECIYQNDDYSISNIYLLENQIIVAASNMQVYGLNQNDDFYVLQDNSMNLLARFGESIGSTVGADVRLGANPNHFVYQNKLYFTTTSDDHVNLCTLSLDGFIEEVYQMNGSLDGIFRIKDQVYTVGLYKQKLQEIYLIDLENKQLKQQSRFNQNVLKNHYVAIPKEYIVKYDSHEVKGFVLFPKDYHPSKKYPAILNIHGGPKTVYGKVYYHEMQYWANEGYIVFFANPRGSDGKGDEFADIRGKYGTIDYADLMAFTKHVIKKVEAIDEKRLFVTGGSYGGFMTNWIVGQTHMFRAAATQRSISNWLSFYGTSDIGYHFSKDQTDGHPNLDTSKLWDQSPIKYAMNINTPLLFIHSDQDYRCPIEQAMQLYTILKERNVQSKLVWFKGETHELSRSGKPQARIKRLNEITNWFNAFKV